MELCPGIYQTNCTTASRCYAVLQPEGATLIDTSYPGYAGKILRELRDYGIRKDDIRRILLTHCDADHIGSAAKLRRETGCEIYIDTADLPIALGQKHTENLKGLFSRILRVKCPEETMPLPETDRIGDFTVLRTPGHSPGHCCYRWNDVLFLGDLVFSTRDRHRSAPAALIVQRTKQEATKRRLNLHGVQWLCPAHTEPVHLSQPW